MKPSIETPIEYISFRIHGLPRLAPILPRCKTSIPLRTVPQASTHRYQKRRTAIRAPFPTCTAQLASLSASHPYQATEVDGPAHSEAVRHHDPRVVGGPLP